MVVAVVTVAERAVSRYPLRGRLAVAEAALDLPGRHGGGVRLRRRIGIGRVMQTSGVVGKLVRGGDETGCGEVLSKLVMGWLAS